ncbi:helix-turn-helix domain-containing protein [Pedobacter fastidiosus]|uniref:helix-turn-helix domain-containing protein n=1 Tax=Pedobacter fastidiosus TaxID=2765361 RepID=UPI00361E43A9
MPDDRLPVVPDIQKIMRIEACYHIGEVERKYNISNKALYELIKRHEIPKLKCGKFTYVPKSMIDNLFKI